ncbi:MULTISPECIES: hypothetical protein [unclassified Burkholderia]|uniref:hypothetical protein n=1 Tax=unclassified Burkholderia TaxID=2613784 RepID=UPI0009ECC343|nr:MULTISPECIES: hypothetical protein [unclassified Burkholderia]
MNDDFLQSRLDAMIDLRHPLAVLATRMPRAQIEASFARCSRVAIARGRPLKQSICSAWH